MDIDDFELPDDDMEAEAELTEIDKTKLEIVKSMKSMLDKLEGNIIYQEKQEFDANFRNISRYTENMIDVIRLEENEEDKSVIAEKLEQIKLGVVEMDYETLGKYKSDEEYEYEGKSEYGLDSIDPKSDDDGDDGLDF